MLHDDAHINAAGLGWNGKTFFPEQRMTREQALRSYTIDAAFAAFEEDVKGSIQPGKLADLTVLSNNLLDCAEDEILATRIVYTIVGGQATAEDILDRNMDVGQDGTGNSIFPNGVSVTGVTAEYDCIEVTGVGFVPVAVVDASIQIQLPFAGLFAFFGTPQGQLNTTIRDQSRIYGL